MAAVRVIPGYSEWLIGRHQVKERLFTKKIKSRMGVPDGMHKDEATRLWAIAKEKAKANMATPKKAGLVDPTDDRAEAALLATLEVMHSPMNQTTKLAAARQVLEWTKAKPAAASTVTVNHAEQWLSSLTDEAEAD